MKAIKNSDCQVRLCIGLLQHLGQAHCGARTLSSATQAGPRLDSFYDSTVAKYAQQPLEVLTLKDMLSFGVKELAEEDKVLKSARYVQRELPKRLARRLLDLQLLPYIVVSNPHIRQVYDHYYSAFASLHRLPPVACLQDNAHFSGLLRKLLDQQAPMLDILARGLRECRRKEVVGPCLSLDAFFDSMLRSRISRRVIAEQHLHIADKRPGYIGIICTHLSVLDAVEFAAQKTRQVSMETYGQAAEVLVSGDVRTTLPYIPAHLDYMLYELLKNAMRAVVENHQGRQYGSPSGRSGTSRPPRRTGARNEPVRLPHISVRICASNEAVTIRVSDQGGGIPQRYMDDVWSYGFTTADEDNGAGSGSAGSGDQGSTSSGGWQFGTAGRLPMRGLASAAGAGQYRMAGLGFGLPMTRLYARYFGGELKLQVIPGYGTDAYLTIKRLEEYDWREVVEQQGPQQVLVLNPHHQLLGAQQQQQQNHAQQ